MGPREVDTENCQPSLEGFLCGLLCMEADNAVAYIRLIAKDLSGSEIPASQGEQL